MVAPSPAQQSEDTLTDSQRVVLAHLRVDVQNRALHVFRQDAAEVAELTAKVHFYKCA